MTAYLVLASLIPLTVMMGAILKWLPQNKKLDNDREDRLADRDKTQAEALLVRVDGLEQRLNQAVNEAHHAQLQMTTLNAAFQLVASELSRKEPDNPVLKQARELVASAPTTDLGFGMGVRRMVAALDEHPSVKMPKGVE